MRVRTKGLGFGNKQEAVGLKKFFDISLTECKPLADDHMDSKKRRKRPNQ